MAKMSQKERIEQLTDEMNKSIGTFQTDPEEQFELLDYLSRFNNYSTRNIVLIKSQYQGGVGVSSYKQHKENGHQVQKGEKAIRILAPRIQDVYYNEKGDMKFMSQTTKKEKKQIHNGELKTEKDKLVGYLSVPVFDLTQTDCPVEEYPNLYPNRPESYSFNGEQEDLERLENTIENIAKRKGISITDETIHSAAKGYYSPREEKIILQNNLSETERPKVLLHELAHAEMHNANSIIEKIKNEEDISTPIKEYQAEMTAYVVSTEIGLDTKESSLGYLSSWQNENPQYSLDSGNYIQALSEVRNVSDELSTEIFEEYQSLEKDKTQEQFDDNELTFTIDYKDKNGNSIEKEIAYPSSEAPITNLVHSEKATDFEIKNLPKELNYLEGKVSSKEIDRFENVIVSYQENKQFSNTLGTDIKENHMNLTEHIQDQYPTENKNIAERMYFLNDEKNINNFEKLKDTNLKPVKIFTENKSNYQNNYLQLTDGEDTYNQKISTPTLKNKELKKWEKGMTGNEWLETDMNFQINKEKPHQYIQQTNFYENNEVSDNLKSFDEYIKENNREQKIPSL